MKNDTLKGFCALVVTIVTLLVFSTNHASAFEVITGSVTEISGPDDLKLNPDKAIIAVDVFGDNDRSVNGVTFFSDRAGRGDGVAAATTAAAAQRQKGPFLVSMSVVCLVMRPRAPAGAFARGAHGVFSLRILAEAGCSSQRAYRRAASPSITFCASLGPLCEGIYRLI